MRKIVIAALIAISLSPCTSVAGEVIALGSGKLVALLTHGPLISTGGAPTALMLQYRTSLPLDDKIALTKEVNEIWDKFEIDAEKGDYTTAVISAESLPETGAGETGAHKSFRFAFEKKGASWRMLEPVKRTSLDKASVTEFEDRLDFAFNNNEMISFLLYLSDDWKYTLTNTQKNTVQTLDRLAFARQTRSVLAATKNFHHERQILAIDIANDVKSAKIESNEITTGIYNGKEIKDSEHTTDFIELRDENILVTKSVSEFSIH